MKYKISLSISALCFLMAFLLLLTIRARSQEALASRIAPNILRFHVLAESNRAEDQELKIGVKNLILAYVHSQAPAAADKETLSQWLMENQEKNRDTIRGMAEKPGMLRPGSPGAGQRLLSLQILRGYGISLRILRCGQNYNRSGRGEELVVCALPVPLFRRFCSRGCPPLPPAGNSPPYWLKKTMRRSCRRAGFPPHPPLPVVLSPPVVPAPPDASAPGGGSDPDGIFVPEVSGNPGDSQEKKPEIQVKSRLLEIISGFGS